MRFANAIIVPCFGLLGLAQATTTALNERTLAAPTGCTKIDPPPKDYVCGGHGHLAPGKGFLTFKEQHTFAAPKKVPDLNACRDLCVNRKAPAGNFPKLDFRCQTFAFDSKTKLCHFYKRSVNSVFRKNKKSSVQYWDVDCFKCPPVSCPQPAGVNLIDNGGFEDSNTLLGPFSNIYAAQPIQGEIEHPGRNSKNAWKCRGEFCSLYHWRLLCPEQLYTLSFDYKIDKGPKSTVYAMMGDAFYAVDHGTNGTDGKWKHVDITFENIFQLDIFEIDWAQSCSQCNYYIHVDNVKVLPHSGSYPTVPGSEIKWPNYNFESGKLSPWKFIRYYGKGNHSIVSPGLSGSKHAFKYNGNNTRYYDYFRLENKLPKLVRDVNYVLKFDYKVFGKVDIAPAMSGSQWDPNGGTSLAYPNYTWQPPQNRLLKYERLFTVSQPDDNLFYMDIIRQDDDGQGPYPDVVQLDNFSIARAAN